MAFDPIALEQTKFGASSGTWAGAVLASDGKIYGTPRPAPGTASILVIDPAREWQDLPGIIIQRLSE